MSQLEDSPAGLLDCFRENILEGMDQLEEDDDLARQLIIAVLHIVSAASETARMVEQQGERNESA